MARYKRDMEVFLTKEAQSGVDGDLNGMGMFNMMNPAGKRKGDGAEKKSRKKGKKKAEGSELMM